MATGENWSPAEVEATVADYLHMLTQELAGQSYSKAAHRRTLQLKLDGRSEAAIERKHQNVSAVLIELGCPWISGYKPLPNYQALLFDVVTELVAGNATFDRVAIGAAEQPAVVPLSADYDELLTDAPPVRATEPAARYRVQRVACQRDYLEREARNRSLGIAGEKFVLAYEHHRLRKAGCARLSERVEHVAQTKGDGLGFDILSFDTSGRERFIEVKTTAFGKETPFFISRNEVDLSVEAADQFHLYRLYEFRRQARLFTLTGEIRRHCLLDAVSFAARFS